MNRRITNVVNSQRTGVSFALCIFLVMSSRVFSEDLSATTNLGVEGDVESFDGSRLLITEDSLLRLYQLGPGTGSVQRTVEIDGYCKLVDGELPTIEHLRRMPGNVFNDSWGTSQSKPAFMADDDLAL